MKKKLSLALAAVLSVSMLASCSSGETEQTPVEENTTAQVVETESVQPQAQSEAPAEESIPAQSNSATVGDYYVEIKSAALSQDYEGNPAIIITYSWTNNSEDTTSALTAVSCNAFQNGVGLETAIIMSDDYDSGSSMTEVRPGTTIDIQSAFVLQDTMSVVEVEVGEWLTWDDDPPIAYMEFNLAEL